VAAGESADIFAARSEAGPAEDLNARIATSAKANIEPCFAKATQGGHRTADEERIGEG